MESTPKHQKTPSLVVTVPEEPDGEPKLLTAHLMASPLSEQQDHTSPFPNLSSPVHSTFAPSPIDDLEAQKKQNFMKGKWDECMQRYLDRSDGYDHVSVLIVKWKDEISDLPGTSEEVLELEKVFRNLFNYETEIVELDDKKTPSAVLRKGVSDLALHRDSMDDHNLIIVYYTGHGYMVDDQHGIGPAKLYFTASSQDVIRKRRTIVPQACWNDIETSLLVNCDVLTIFDTCFAGNLIHSRLSRPDDREETIYTFEHIAATGYDKVTVGPGEKSFTNCLIRSLKGLHKEFKGKSFTTFHLQQRMARERPEDAPELWNRLFDLRVERHIRIGPQKRPEEHQNEGKGGHTDESFLILRFAVDKSRLNEDEIDEAAECIAKACRELTMMNVRGVDWLHLGSRKSIRTSAAATAAVEKFREIAQRVSRTHSVRSRLSHTSNVSSSSHGGNLEPVLGHEQSGGSTSHKRSSSSLDPAFSLPAQRRRTLSNKLQSWPVLSRPDDLDKSNGDSHEPGFKTAARATHHLSPHPAGS